MSNDQPLINLSVKEWSKDQKLAITRASSQALTQSSLGEPWSTNYWKAILTYLNITQEQFGLSLYGYKKKDMNYDSRSRRFLLELEHVLCLTHGDLNSVERSVSQQIYYALQQQEQASHTTNMDASAKKALQEGSKRNKALRWAATGAGILGGGAVIALTGGLAAPLLAPFLVGITGASFFATAGGVALVTSLFGLTGGGLAGWKMHRRMKGISVFEFQQILNDPDLPPIPSLHCTICISGFLLDSENEIKAPWELAFGGKHGNNNDIYCLEYETKELLELGYSFRKFVRDSAAKYAGMEIAKTTFLKAVFAAVALPATILKAADVIDNPWQIAVDRSKKAGLVLADVLQERVQGNRPCNLVAYSCGCLVIWNCLLELHKRGCVGLVDHVVLMGAPISSENIEEWNQVQSVVSGEFVNCYTSNDWVLAFVYRLHSFAVNVAGLEPVKIGRIRNFEVSEVDGHTKYPEVIKDILDQINLE
ncbi:hypothetical protein G6F46_004664 [Rhizopus delemar]|uniref:DUF726-domain-containing protein n=2 Tax=Rhizopus TaxID=4842 RepID=A0A9P7CUN7_9FUNG|nr:hypothetical protein G6F55_003360 [Rhizopus delemar]KAG1546997.1 hypothetical protein G6F51_004533 [Rhizopus arrhizus]KAG1502564.1 hypothetical protein G6F54_002271 [Rhizopus delemar]KAG1516314.1 hypothetical protein G6F53_002250 [Rhizopus delemar]KAG1527706.1 hypothetical protein G6F52_001293 [Rhizopus delemar]